MMPEEDGYVPCEACGDEMSETLQKSEKWVCESCFNAQMCGCDICIGVVEGAHLD